MRLSGETSKGGYMKAKIAIVVLACLLSASAMAAADGYGPKDKRFGAGLYFGEPTGITLKGYVAKGVAIQGQAAWSFVDNSILGIVDLTYDFVNIPVDSSAIKLP